MREQLIALFLDDAGWGGASLVTLAGDASPRRYFRVTGKDGARAVLMDAPSQTDQNIGPFLAIATYLARQGFSAPAIYHADQPSGLVLMEDLGDDLLARCVTRDPSSEQPLYLAATDFLVQLHQCPLPADVPAFGPQRMASLTEPAFVWYGGLAETPPKVTDALTRALDDPTAKSVLILRDFHAENLLWLPDRDGARKVGLLDFQDAQVGHPSYDLMSLVRDARRDVTPDVRWACIARYADQAVQDLDHFQQAASAQGAQRNLRILGVFARLSLHFGKPQYIDLIPRVWTHLMEDLAHPALVTLRSQLMTHLPEPTPTFLNELKARCGTIHEAS